MLLQIVGQLSPLIYPVGDQYVTTPSRGQIFQEKLFRADGNGYTGE